MRIPENHTKLSLLSVSKILKRLSFLYKKAKMRAYNSVKFKICCIYNWMIEKKYGDVIQQRLEKIDQRIQEAERFETTPFNFGGLNVKPPLRVAAQILPELKKRFNDWRHKQIPSFKFGRSFLTLTFSILRTAFTMSIELAQLRKQLRKQRRQVSAYQQQQSELQILQRLRRVPEFKHATRVGIYLHAFGEIQYP